MSDATLKSRAWSCGSLEAGVKACAKTAGLDISQLSNEEVQRALKDLSITFAFIAFFFSAPSYRLHGPMSCWCVPLL